MPPPRRPQVPQSNVPNRPSRPRRPQVPQSSQSLVPHESNRRPRSVNQLALAEPAQRRRPPNALVPHKPQQRRRDPNALVEYEEPEQEYYDEYYEEERRPPPKPMMAQFCEPRCCILLLLLLFFGLLLLIASILLVMSIDKGDPEGIAGWTYPIPARDPNGYGNDQTGDRFGTALDSAGEFLIISAPERRNPNGSKGAVFLYVWLGSYWAVYGSDGILTPPDVDYQSETWLDFYKDDVQQSRVQKEANRVHFDNDSKNAVKWADDGERIAIGVPSKNSIVLYEFTHPLKESDYIASITVEGPYQDAGRNIAISADGNRVALTALYNESLVVNATNATTTTPDARWLEEITADSTNTTNTTNVTGLPGVVLVYDYLPENQTWVPVGDPIRSKDNSTSVTDGWGDNMVMSFDGSTIAVSNPTYEDDLGMVDLYRILNATNGTYEYTTTLEGDASGGQFGFAMAINADGTVVAVTAPFYNKGNVNVYEFNSGSYVDNDQTYYTASWSQKGFAVGDDVGEWFGYDVAIAENGNSMAVGAPKGNDGVGKMIIYDYTLGRWYPYTAMPQKDQYGNYQGSGNYGASVAMTNNGDSITIGAPNHTAASATMDYVEFFDKSPKGMNLTGRARPAHVLAEHPDDDTFG